MAVAATKNGQVVPVQQRKKFMSDPAFSEARENTKGTVFLERILR